MAEFIPHDFENVTFIPEDKDTPSSASSTLLRGDAILSLSENTGITKDDARVRYDEMESSAGAELAQEEAKQFNQHLFNQGYDSLYRTVIEEPGYSAPEAVSFLMAQKEKAEREFGEVYGWEASQEAAFTGMTKNASEEYMKRVLHESVFSDRGPLTWLFDASGLLLPDTLWDLSNFTGQNMLTWEGGIENSPAVKGYLAMVATFHSYSPEVKATVFPMLVEKARESTNNNGMKMQAMLLPFIDPSLVDMKAEAAFGGLDMVLTGAGILGPVLRTARTVHTVGRASRLASKEAAAKATVENLQDDTGAISSVLGRERVDSASDVHPGKFETVLPDVEADLKGASASFVARVEATIASIKGAVKPIFDREWLHVSMLTDEERNLFRTKSLQDVSSYLGRKFLDQGFSVRHADIIERTDKGFKVKVELLNTTTGEARTVTSRDLFYTVDGVIQNGNVSGNSVKTWWLSPELWMGAALKEGLVQEATLISFQQNRIANMLKRGRNEIWKGLSKQERNNVEAVVTAGNDWVDPTTSTRIGKQFTYDELVNEGVSVIDPRTGAELLVRLNQKEAERYFAYQYLSDVNFVLTNKVVRDQMVNAGFMRGEFSMGMSKSTELTTTLDNSGRTLPFEEVIIKPFIDEGSIPKNILNRFTVASPLHSGGVRLTKKLIEEMYEKGYVLGRLHDGHKGKGIGLKYDYGFVRGETLTEVPLNVIHKRTGYVSRVYDDAPYMVVRTTNVVRNGVEAEGVRQVVRLFDNVTDAKAWAAKMTSESKSGSVYKEVHKNNRPEGDKLGDIIDEMGGLFIDPRHEELKFGLNGDRPKKLDAIRAMDRQLNMIAQRLPMNDWRMSVIARWEKAAKAVMDQYNPKSDRTPTFHEDDALFDLPAGSKARDALEGSRRWIRDQLMMKTPSERKYETYMVNVAEWMEGRSFIPDGVRKGFLNAGSKDPFSAARAVTFHALLGIFNPAQLLVQAQGAAIALSLIPAKNWKTVMQEYTALRILSVWDGNVNSKVLDGMAKAAGMTRAELLELHREFKLSGLMDSVKTNADLEAVKWGYGMDTGLIKRALFDHGLLFYREGELFTRGMAFIAARHKQFGSGGARKLTEKELVQVVENATHFMLNLNRANRAQGWQRGAWSIPTQFQQITWKFVEAMWPGSKKFTGKEKARILTGQFLLYGTAGIPLTSWMTGELLRYYGADESSIPDAVKAQLTNGLLSMLSDVFTGEALAFGARGGAASGVEMLIKDLLLDQAPVTEAFLGAFGGLTDRAAKVIGRVAPLIYSDKPTTISDWTIALSSMTSIISSLNNTTKAWYWWQAQAALDSYNIPLRERREFDNFLAAVLFKAGGIQPLRVESVYDMEELNRSATKRKTDATKAVTQLIGEHLAGDKWRDPRQQESINGQIRAILRFYPQNERNEIERRAWDTLILKDSRYQRAFDRMIETSYDEDGIASTISGGTTTVYGVE